MDSPSVTLGLVQMKCEDDPRQNLEKAVASIEQAASQGAQIICLPELFLSPYFCQGPKNEKNFILAEPIPGPTTDALGKLAKRHKLIILCPLFEKTINGKYFNSVAIVGIDGTVKGAYHKMHIPSLPPGLYSEDYYFEKGDRGFMVFDTPYGKIAPLICYDQWFPEGARMAAANGAQIIFYPTAIGWPQKDRGGLQRAEHEAWQTIQRSHAIANNVFVAAVNRVGTENNLKFWGTSFVSDPYGRVIAQASTVREENLIVKCDLSMISAMRKDWPFLEERRVRCEDNEINKITK